MQAELDNAAMAGRSGAAALAGWAGVAAIGAIPLVFAALTWQRHYELSLFRSFGVPVLVAEVVLFAIAVAAGAKPFAVIGQASPATRLSLLLLIELSVVGVFSAPLNVITAAVSVAIDLCHLAALVAVAALFERNAVFRRQLVPALALGLTAYCMLVYTLMLSHGALYVDLMSHVGAGVTNVRYLAHYGLAGAFLAFGLALHEQERRLRLGWLACATLCEAFILWSGTRAGVVAILATAVVAVALLDQVRARRLAIDLLATAPVAVALSMIWVPPSDLYGLFNMSAASGSPTGDLNVYSSNRLAIWSVGLQSIAQRPWLGFGQGQFMFLDPELIGHATNPHNFVIQFLFDWGVAGGMVALALLARFVVGAAIGARHGRPDQATAFLALTALLAAGLLDGTFYHVLPTFLIVVLLATANFGVTTAARRQWLEALVRATWPKFSARRNRLTR